MNEETDKKEENKNTIYNSAFIPAIKPEHIVSIKFNTMWYDPPRLNPHSTEPGTLVHTSVELTDEGVEIYKNWTTVKEPTPKLVI